MNTSSVMKVFYQIKSPKIGTVNIAKKVFKNPLSFVIERGKKDLTNSGWGAILYTS